MVEYILKIVVFMEQGTLILEFPVDSCLEPLQSVVGTLYEKYLVIVLDCFALITI